MLYWKVVIYLYLRYWCKATDTRKNDNKPTATISENVNSSDCVKCNFFFLLLKQTQKINSKNNWTKKHFYQFCFLKYTCHRSPCTPTPIRCAGKKTDFEFTRDEILFDLLNVISIYFEQTTFVSIQFTFFLFFFSFRMKHSKTRTLQTFKTKRSFAKKPNTEATSHSHKHTQAYIKNAQTKQNT